METAIYIVLGLIGAFLLFYMLPMLIISNTIFTVLLVRTSKKKWSRGLSWDDAEQQRMFDEGAAWGEVRSAYRRDLKIKSGKFRLVGEYFDFGSDKAVIIIPGRMETSAYSYYFAKPYEDAGYNVLAIDNRSHGLSDGRYNCVGMKEYVDILAWAKTLHDDLGVKTIVLHGICIGSATALYAMTSAGAPDYLAGMVADGMYVDFRETLKNHFLERKRPLFPCLGQVTAMMTIVAGISPVKFGPINVIDKMKKPILFIYSRQDAYSLPEKGMELFEKCGSENKRIEFFDRGVHSHVRINAVGKYDETVRSFIASSVGAGAGGDATGNEKHPRSDLA